MDIYDKGIVVIKGVVVGVSILLFGGYDDIIRTLYVLMIIDYITGVMNAIYNKELSSDIGGKGIFKKVMILLLVATSTQIESVLVGDIPVRSVIIFFFISNEGISILENAKNFIPIPQKLIDVLGQMKGNNNDKN